MSDPGVDTQVRKALERERGKAGEWLTRFWPILASLGIAALTIVGGYYSFREALNRAAQEAHTSLEVLQGNPRDGQIGLIQQVRENTRELERRRAERAAADAEVIRKLDSIAQQQTALLERMVRMETKIEGGR